MLPEIIAPNKEKKLSFVAATQNQRQRLVVILKRHLTWMKNSDSDKHYSNYNAAFSLFNLMTCPSLKIIRINGKRKIFLGGWHQRGRNNQLQTAEGKKKHNKKHQTCLK